MLLLSLCITACGEQTGADSKTEEAIAEDGVSAGNTAELEKAFEGNATELEKAFEGNAAEFENPLAAEDEALTEKAAEPAEENAGGGRSEQDDAITLYLSEEITYSDEIIPVQYVDDLSLLEEMKYTDSTYACRDGKLYYRRYHENSFEEAAM